MFRRLVTVPLLALALAACSEATTPVAGNGTGGGQGSGSSAPGAANPSPGSAQATTSSRVDPRRGGLEIGLAEWALTSEASAIRPGPVTFLISNKGTMTHGFEIELEGESSGSGSGDLFKAEARTLQPGETTRLRLDLPPGVYKIECLVSGHDDRGMEDFLEVRAGAPLQKRTQARPEGQIAISDLAFAPAVAEVSAGTHVTWTNEDPTEHTVTAEDGAFGSQTLGSGDTFSFHAGEPGTFRYVCAIHPEMKGVLKVR